MNKKLLTAAIGAALVSGVGIAQADVKIGGTINMSVDSIKGCKTTACTENGSNWQTSSNASNIVLTATEDLGGGLKGVFSWQEFIRADNNNGENTSLTGGNTYLGLGGKWGTVMAGNHDSGAKLNGRTFDLFGNQIGDSRNFDVNNNRVNNLIAYMSPAMNGFSALVAHSTNTDGGTTTAAPAYDSSTQADSLMLKYAQGPLTIGVGYDKLKPGDGVTSSSSNDTKWTNFGVKFDFGTGTSIIGFYQKHDDATYSGTTRYDWKTTGIGLSQKFGNNVAKFQYYEEKLDFAGGAPKPKLWALGLDHYFSKTFNGYIAYAKSKNETDGTVTSLVSMAGGGHGDNPGTVAGKDMDGFSIGAIFKF